MENIVNGGCHKRRIFIMLVLFAGEINIGLHGRYCKWRGFIMFAFAVYNCRIKSVRQRYHHWIATTVTKYLEESNDNVVRQRQLYFTNNTVDNNIVANYKKKKKK